MEVNSLALIAGLLGGWMIGNFIAAMILLFWGDHLFAWLNKHFG